MKTIIFIGLNKSGSSREAVKTAEKMGFYTVVFTNKEKQIEQREEYSDVHQLIFLDINNMDLLKKQITLLQQKGNEIVAITSFVDQYVYIASVLADEYCQNPFLSEAISIMEDKKETRRYFSNEPYTPSFIIVKQDLSGLSNDVLTNMKFPLMVKCSTSTGSKDVLYAGKKSELKKHVLKLRKKYPDEAIIIEEYIDGDQFLVEVVVYNGQINIAALIEQEITIGKRFIITGYAVLPEVQSEIENGIKNIIESITTLLKIKNGTFHLELRQTKDGWKLIEINPRISGGAMNKMIHAAFGYNLVEETLKILIGEKPSLERKTSHFVFTQYVIVDQKGVLEKVTGKRRAMKSSGVVDVYVKPKKGTIINPPLSMGHRYAYVIATGNTKEEAMKLAKDAANEIEFHIKKDE